MGSVRGKLEKQEQKDFTPHSANKPHLSLQQKVKARPYKSVFVHVSVI